MDENGMENEHLEHKNSSNTEYLPTKCRVTKPPPPKPATNPLQFIKVAPPPLFQKAKEQVNKVEKIKKERKELQDETEDWQANLDNWKSSRRKLQEHIIERVVEVKKFEQEDPGRTRRKSKTFNEILQERGKSKYSIPIYTDETNDWSDYGISDSKSEDSKTSGRNGLETTGYSSDEFSSKKDDFVKPTTNTSFSFESETKLNNNNSKFNDLAKKTADESMMKNGQYTYEGAIEGYRSRIKSRIDDSILVKIAELPKRNSEVELLVPKGEIVKRKELFNRQQSDSNNVTNMAAHVLQDFENSVSIKQRLKSLEKCSDQTVKYVDNINIRPKVKKISQLFDKPCTDNLRNNYNNEVTVNNNDYSKREKININIVPWVERETASDSSEIDIFTDKNDFKEVENQSDDKSSDTFYSGLEDTNYPPSISSTDYMALSSDREDSGIHTADVSCSVSQADDTAEELESNTNSHETGNDDFQTTQKYFKDMEDETNEFGDHLIKLTEENITHQEAIDVQEEPVSQIYDAVESPEIFSEEETKEEEAKIEEPLSLNNAEIEENPSLVQEQNNPPKIKDELLKADVLEQPLISHQDLNGIGLLNLSIPLLPGATDRNYLFDSDFPLLPTRMVEPPKTKPPPPPVLDEETPKETNVKRMNSTKRIKKEITLKRSNFLGLSEPDDDVDPLEGVSIASREQEHSKVEEILAKQLYETNISDYCSEERQDVLHETDKFSDNETTKEISETNTGTLQKNSTTPEEDEITKREREIIEMIEKAEMFRDTDVPEDEPKEVKKPPIPLSRTFPPTNYVQKPADASYYDKQPDYLDDQDSEVLKVEQELQQLEQEELKRKRDNLLFRQACSRVFAKNKRYSLENILDVTPIALECRKSMPELQCLKIEKEPPVQNANMFRSINDMNNKYRKSVPNIPGYLYSGYNRADFQTIDKSLPQFQHDIHRSAFDVPARKQVPSYDLIGNSGKSHLNNKFIQPGDTLAFTKPFSFDLNSGDGPLVKPRNRNTWLKTRPNVEAKTYDQHWLYQEAELRRIQDQKKYTGWQQSKLTSDSSVPNLVQRGAVTPSHGSSKSSIRKLGSVNNETKRYLEHPPIGPPLPVTQPRPIGLEESQNRILSVSGKKKCSFCGNELGRGAAMIIETLCLFYHMECFKCCVCHVQLGNGLNGTDVRVRNQKLHCHNCYSSDDGVKFSCV